MPERVRYCGPTLLQKLQNWANTLDFQRQLAAVGREEIRQWRPDVLHQVTISTWRIGNPLVGQGVPFVWGPIGGGEEIPPGFLAGMSATARIYERARRVAGFLARRSRSVRTTAREADWVFAGNRCTADLLRRLGVTDTRLSVLPQMHFSRALLDRFNQAENAPVANRPLRLFSGGYLEGRKGLHLSLQALHLLKQKGVAFAYHHGGGGPGETYLKRMVRRLGLENEVGIMPPYRGDAYRRQLTETDIFLMPTLRDNCPASLLEAMGYGCVPVVADTGGVREIVDSRCGFPIAVDDPGTFVSRLADVIVDLAGRPDKRARYASLARKHVIDRFSSEAWLRAVEPVYARLAGRNAEAPARDQSHSASE